MPKILVADDDQDVAMLVKMTPERVSDYIIDTAGNGEEPLKKVFENIPGLAPLDITFRRSTGGKGAAGSGMTAEPAPARRMSPHQKQTSKRSGESHETT